MPEIEFQPITPENFRAVIDLKVRKHQDSFVATNVQSIAQSYIFPSWRPRAIVAAGTPVGFALTAREAATGHMWIIRFMIGAEHQGRGYGRAALLALIAELRAEAPGCEIRLSYEPGNAAAAGLYRAVGFQETGAIEDGELIMRLADELPVASQSPL